MRKIISLFVRDYEGTRLVYDEVVEGAEWVIAGEGVDTRKFDGTCCMVRDGKLYKRRDLKKWKGNKVPPEGWEAAQPERDSVTGHWPGWMLVGEGPEDEWHREAWKVDSHLPNGTYELAGPKVQGNPEEFASHTLVRHRGLKALGAPRTFNELREWFKSKDIEGIVWHHADGRMVKIKKKDFGLKRKEGL